MSDDVSARYGIAEWFGRRVQSLSAEERTEFANEAQKSSPGLPCLPRASQAKDGALPSCTKAGGVCSIRRYKKDDRNPNVGIPAGGPVVALCPHRFEEGDKIYSWTGDVVLGNNSPDFVKEIPFLERVRHYEHDSVWGHVVDSEEPTNEEEDDESDDPSDRDVGRIDGILIDGSIEENSIEGDDLESQFALDLTVRIKEWCGLEIQAVYFSGKRMSVEYAPFTKLSPPDVPFPKKTRRADFRSSSAKRLLPQLQTKIPSLRRWGKKMAVVVDDGFFYKMAEMDEVDHISNCDIVWIVVTFEREDDGFVLRRRGTHLTTLEDAVIGLTAGEPVPLSEFEKRVEKKYKTPRIDEEQQKLGRIQDRLQDMKKPMEVLNRERIALKKRVREKRRDLEAALEACEDDELASQLEEEINKCWEIYRQQKDLMGLLNRLIRQVTDRYNAATKVRADLNRSI